MTDWADAVKLTVRQQIACRVGMAVAGLVALSLITIGAVTAAAMMAQYVHPYSTEQHGQRYIGVAIGDCYGDVGFELTGPNGTRFYRDEC